MNVMKRLFVVAMVLTLALCVMVIGASAAMPCEEIGHTPEYFAEQPACHMDGVKAHYYCSECDVYYLENGMNTSWKDLVIPAIGSDAP